MARHFLHGGTNEVLRESVESTFWDIVEAASVHLSMCFASVLVYIEVAHTRRNIALTQGTIRLLSFLKHKLTRMGRCCCYFPKWSRIPCPRTVFQCFSFSL
ncbi:hypothetical protein TRVL_09881 [Trypanosoma vivax]|nr:hypothetical protein TRVL_09881 [Trypanosoma vivax]